MRLLVIEDDPMVGRAVQRGLEQSGYAVDWVADGRGGELALCEDLYALVILDLGLPAPDGLTLLRRLRARHASVPVLIISARDTVTDRIAGLDSGADDYLLKPFDLDELTARVRALLRRDAGRSSNLMTAGSLTLDPLRRTVVLAGRTVDLTAKEFAVLETLMRRPGAVLSRERLEESIYGWGEEIGSNAVEVHVHNLRRKLGPDVIKNIRGVGYKISE